MRSLIVAVPFLLLAGCVAPGTSQPPVATAPIQAPPPPAASVAPAGSDWRDWPLTPGDWRYVSAAAGRSMALFGIGGAVEGALVAITCRANERRVTLAVAGPPGTQPLTIRTSSTARTLPITVTAQAPASREVQLTPTDPILDAMGYSRGRFVIEQPGVTPLVIPAWPEILRVAEDCRR